MIIYDDDGVGYDVIPRQNIEDAIAEIQRVYNDDGEENTIWACRLRNAIEIIRKHMKEKR